MATTDDDIVVQWWRYSDQTGSTWPDDDANLRAGNMGIELNESRSILNGNNSEQRQHLIDVEGTFFNPLRYRRTVLSLRRFDGSTSRRLA